MAHDSPHSETVRDKNSSERAPRSPRIRRTLNLILLGLALVYVAPVLLSAGLYFLNASRGDWRSADRSSVGLLPPASESPPAAVRIFSARTVSWRGIVATHSWIVIKDEGASDYERFDYTAWGAPISRNRFAPDARWFGSPPDVTFAADGPEAARMIPQIRAAIRDYPYAKIGDYRSWPGPNSNTFVAAVMAAAPGMLASLPATAIGKDYPHDGRYVALTPSGAGVRISLGGYLGLTLGWAEGIELNLLGLVAGIDLRRPALKFPGLGRVGL